MASGTVGYVEDAAVLARSLTPLRRDLLERLVRPASATELAAELGLARQKVNYHLRQLEDAGLVRLVEERQRRGCTERILQAVATSFVVDPGVLGPAAATASADATSGDRFASEHLVHVAARTVRDVGRMQAAATAAGKRLLTFTIESEVRLASPAAAHDLVDDLAAAVAEVLARHDRAGGRRHRIVLGGHPAATPRPATRPATPRPTTRPATQEEPAP